MFNDNGIVWIAVILCVLGLFHQNIGCGCEGGCGGCSGNGGTGSTGTNYPCGCR